MSQQRPFEFRAYHRPTSTLFTALYFTEYEVFRTPNHAYWLDECVLMQFTGLYDCQGKKVFEGDVLYSYFPAHDREPSREYWRVVGFKAGGFCELASLDEQTSEIETMWLAQYRDAQQSDRLPDRIVGCYYLNPDLLSLNTESAEVPTTFV